MKAKVIFAFVGGAVALAAIFAFIRMRAPAPGIEPPQPQVSSSSAMPELPAQPRTLAALPASRPSAPALNQNAAAPTTQTLPASTNKLEGLMQVRETFHKLAAGDKTVALRAAKQITDPNERETALLTLVTEWTKGELSPPGERASRIGQYGLEAGLGIELAKNPELALLWANELTDGQGRAALVQQIGIAMVGSDPTAAFALGNQLPPEERSKFLGALFAGWAETDTEAAIQWAKDLPDPAQQDAAMQAIRSAAPVGIGAEMKMVDGYPVINGLLPGTPAELSGQLHPGDRIMAVMQGDNTFVDANSLSLHDVVQMIRGAPGTLLQLQVLPADAPLGTAPQTISIIRDQIKFKR